MAEIKTQKLKHPKYIADYYDHYFEVFKPYMKKHGEICLNKAYDNEKILGLLNEFNIDNKMIVEDEEYAQWWIPNPPNKQAYGYTYVYVEQHFNNHPTIVVWDRIYCNDTFYYREEFIKDSTIPEVKLELIKYKKHLDYLVNDKSHIVKKALGEIIQDSIHTI